jgi:membrane-associated protease RseP (regulator of RpoE activity)
MIGYIIALAVLLSWAGLMLFLRRRKPLLERHSMSLWGPAIMWKTRKGREFVDRIASRRRFWNFYASLSLWICAGSMAFIMILLLWEATIVPSIEEPPSPNLILGIPGLNPVIPVGYGILGLVVAIVVHELAHGIMTRLGNMEIRSMGVLLLVFPIGAFVEPDEEALQMTTRRKRARVFAAGPATNMLLALAILALFSGGMMSSLDPAHEGALAIGVVKDSPMDIAGISPTSVIVSIGGTPVSSSDDLDSMVSDPGALVSVEYYYGGDLRRADEVVDGVVVSYTTDGYAAADAGLEAGMVLLSLNGTVLTTVDDLSDAMALTHSGQVVDVEVMSYDAVAGTFVLSTTITSISLSDKHDFYEEYFPDENEASFAGRGYLGGGFIRLGIDYRDVDYYSNALAHPFEGDKDIGDVSMSWLRLIALPFLDLAPVRSPVTDLYEPSGALAWMPDGVFWVLTNSLYWIFWLNLMLGLTNVLPAVPLDGGYLFRDGMDYILTKVRPRLTKEQRDNSVGSVTLLLALFVLSLILWQLVGPRL